MDIAVFETHGLEVLVHDSILSLLLKEETWVLSPEGRRERLEARHTFRSVLPVDPRWMLERGPLSEAFLKDAAQRALARPEETDLDAVITAFAGQALELRAALVQRLTTRPADEALTTTYLECVRLLDGLRRIAFRAHPHLAALQGNTNPSVSRAVELAELGYQLLEAATPPGTLQAFLDSKPDVAIIQGSLPQLLSFAVALSTRLRKASPKTRIILRHNRNLYSSFGHHLEVLKQQKELFQHADGVIVYTDLAHVTVMDAVEQLEKSDSFEGVENLLSLKDGEVQYHPPTKARIAAYLSNAVLVPESPEHAAFVSPTAHRAAYIVPANQKCYWDRCHFCASSAGSAISNDPGLAKRGKPAAELMLSLIRSGVNMCFLGFEVVAPAVLRHVVERLENEPNPPLWAFEGKIDKWATPEFIKRLAKAGCRGMICGLESASDRINEAMDKHVVGIDLKHVEEVLGWFDEAGIAVQTNTILDLPGSTQDDVQHHSQWLKRVFDKSRFYSFNVNIFSLFRGSRIAAAPEKYGLTPLAALGDTLQQWVEFEPAAGQQRPQASAGATWRLVYGAERSGGLKFERIYQLMEPNLRTLDMRRNEYFLKRRQQEVRALRESARAGLHIPDSVSVFGVEGKDGPDFVWLVDPSRALAARVAGPSWSFLERCADPAQAPKAGEEAFPGDLMDVLADGLVKPGLAAS